MKTLAIIQARMGSTRLPGKVLRPILGKPMLAHLVERVASARGIDQVVVATSTLQADQEIVRFCDQAGIASFTGAENDVLDRYYQAARHYDGDALIRITADCPLADPEVIAALIALYQSGDYDYASVATGAGALFLDGARYPDGYDTECIRRSALERAWSEASAAGDREHVTPYLWRQPERFRQAQLTSPVDHSALRLTVDNEEDFSLIAAIYAALHSPQRHFALPEVVAFLDAHPELRERNQMHVGHEGYEALWRPSAA